MSIRQIRRGHRTKTDVQSELIAELSRHIPLLPCCRMSFVLGAQQTSLNEHGIVGDGVGTDEASGVMVIASTPRRAAGRALVAALHADGYVAHLVPSPRAGHPLYLVEGDSPPSYDRCPGCDGAQVGGAVLARGIVSIRKEHSVAVHTITADNASSLASLLEAHDIAASVGAWRSGWRVQIRSLDAVGDVLAFIHAFRTRVVFEEGRVMRSVRGDVNRTTNAETANLRRTVAAGMRQVEMCLRVEEDRATWERMNTALHVAVRLRKAHPDESLGALAELAGCGKATFAGRMRVIESLARGLEAPRS